MKTLIYLHGYGSDGNSKTAEIIRKELSSFKVINPSYNFRDADRAYKELTKTIDEEQKNCDFLYLVGNSLGGFWANYFANKLKIKSLLINPQLDPVNGLKKYVEARYETFAKYYSSSSNDIRKVVVLGKKDESIAFETFLEGFKLKNYIININEEMGHRVSSIQEITQGLNDLMNLNI